MSNRINLDDLDSAQRKTASGEEVSGVPVYQTRQAAEVYDEFTKIIFVLDDSGSMSDRLSSANEIAAFDFDESHFDLIEQRIENAKVRLEASVKEALNELNEEDDSGEDLFEGEDEEDFTQAIEVPHYISHENDGKDKFWAGLQGKTPEGRKAAVIKHPGALSELGLHDDQGRVSKCIATKRVVKKEIKRRFEKFETPDIQVIKFAENPSLMRAVNRDALIAAVDSLLGGGWDTCIFPAVYRAVQLCEKAPSAVGSHHIILVTDGLSDDGHQCITLLDTMKRKNIVLDFILIADQADIAEDWSSAPTLRELCNLTGGRYFQVDSLKDFETVFFEAAQRLCLPPAPAEG